MATTLQGIDNVNDPSKCFEYILQSRDVPFTLHNMGVGIVGLQICAVYDERWEMMPPNSAEYANARASIVLPLALENAAVMISCSSLGVFVVILLGMNLF